MRRREMLQKLAGLAAAVTLLAQTDTEARAGQKGGMDMFAHCAKACADCEARCAACVKHCGNMVAAGMKEHVKSKRLSEDTRDLCSAAAKICSRKGPMTAAICEACIKSCEACGAECGKYPNMKPMKDCAQACAVCIKACQDMLKQQQKA